VTPRSGQKRIYLSLQLDLGSEPVTGQLVPPGGPPTPFSGYAGLIAALGRICEPRGAETTGKAPTDSDAGADR
jgi:hypothetical protein